eukprot:4355172-Prymnesium_polylepis.3
MRTPGTCLDRVVAGTCGVGTVHTAAVLRGARVAATAAIAKRCAVRRALCVACEHTDGHIGQPQLGGEKPVRWYDKEDVVDTTPRVSDARGRQ